MIGQGKISVYEREIVIYITFTVKKNLNTNHLEAQFVRERQKKNVLYI